MRTAGILMPLFSLPGPWGLGTLGAPAREYVDFLSAAGVGCWQMLPHGPVGEGASPYQSPSAFGGNPLFIDVDALCDDGLLTPDEARKFRRPSVSRVDWDAARRDREQALSLACRRFYAAEKPEGWDAFLGENDFWLPGWAAWAALAETANGTWGRLPGRYAPRAGEMTGRAREILAGAPWGRDGALCTEEGKCTQALFNECNEEKRWAGPEAALGNEQGSIAPSGHETVSGNEQAGVTFSGPEAVFGNEQAGEAPFGHETVFGNENGEAAAEMQPAAFRFRVLYHAFCQFVFFRQWRALSVYAAQKGVALLGDVPIYVSASSADVWQWPGLFQLNEKGGPLAVAGCPPDAFSPTGQLWNNPLYRWEAHALDGYAWWQARVKIVLSLYSGARMDHFRGFESYWAIPAGDGDARGGRWCPGPGRELFCALERAIGRPLPLYAEDLGDITDAVRALRRETGLAGMKVLQFAFSSDGASEYLPHRHTENCVVFTGTHDNDTLAGWVKSAPEWETAYAARYLNAEGTGPDGLRLALLRGAFFSPARFAAAPMQDFLALGSEARMNRPGTVSPENWSWRALPGSLSAGLAAEIRKMLQEAGREGL